MRDATGPVLARRVNTSQHFGIKRSFYQGFEKSNRRLNSRCWKLLHQVVQFLLCEHGTPSQFDHDTKASVDASDRVSGLG